MLHQTSQFAIALVSWASAGLLAQPVGRPLHAQSSSTVDYRPAAVGSGAVDIRNMSYEVTGTSVPGRPPSERLLLRKTAASKQTLGDIGVEATITLDAWPLGNDLHQKPLYTVTTTGMDGRTLDNALFIASRGSEEVEWWSVYKLGSGQHLFDTHVPLIGFSISRETVTTRYVGAEVPPDDTTDPRLRQPNLVAVLYYASENRIIRGGAADLRRPPPGPASKIVRRCNSGAFFAGRAGATRTLVLSFSQNYPSPANSLQVLIPVLGDDLDLAHAQLPARLHISKR